MKVVFFLSSLLCLSSPLSAILPPLYESLKEIKSIVNSPDLTARLQSGELITKIERNDAGFEITTNQHTLQIDVEYIPTGRIGPAEYKLFFHEPIAYRH